MKTIKSRIHQYFSKELLKDLYVVATDPTISDNNMKTDIVIQILNNYKIDFDELGPGTNRFGILVNGYVFKIALDKMGMYDNLMEFSLAQELQPFVAKTYETNEIVAVSEYVTLISREEFENKTDEIRSILSNLSQSYLLGDVGSIPKNYLNWGYRNNGDLVILDYAYIYRINPRLIFCSDCNTMLRYDQNFDKLVCPICNRKYNFMEIRNRMDKSVEAKELELSKQLSYVLYKSSEKFDEDVKENKVVENESNELIERKDDTNMDKIEKSSFDDYEAALESFLNGGEEKNDQKPNTVMVQSSATVTVYSSDSTNLHINPSTEKVFDESVEGFNTISETNKELLKSIMGEIEDGVNDNISNDDDEGEVGILNLAEEGNEPEYKGSNPEEVIEESSNDFIIEEEKKNTISPQRDHIQTTMKVIEPVCESSNNQEESFNPVIIDEEDFNNLIKEIGGFNENDQVEVETEVEDFGEEIDETDEYPIEETPIDEDYDEGE